MTLSPGQLMNQKMARDHARRQEAEAARIAAEQGTKVLDAEKPVKATAKKPETDDAA